MRCVAAVAVAVLALCAVSASASRPSARDRADHWTAAKRRAMAADAEADALSASAPEPWRNYTQTMSWYTQRLDHFDLTDARIWQQRAWVVDDFWRKPDGPVFHYLCGEYTCPGVNPDRLFPLQLAYEHGAKVVVLEHRFYGLSQPLSPMTTSALAYLNSRQALADLSRFQQSVQSGIDKQSGKTQDTRWFVIGGSYPGAMSAWYRLKYPHLARGSLASSAVVHAILEFTAFDEQVARAAGDTCANALRATTAALEAGLSTGVKQLFGSDAAQLSDDDFLYFCADTQAEAVQYGSREALCASATSGTDYVAQFANFSNASGASAGAAGYNTALLASAASGGDGRAWWWQTCTEFGWFQIAPKNGAIRSARVNMAYHLNACQTIFGTKLTPDVEGTNVHYGGDRIAATRVFFTNGQEDPWQWASLRHDRGALEPARVTDCVQCAHCVELYTPAPTDAPELLKTRELSTTHLREWLHADD